MFCHASDERLFGKMWITIDILAYGDDITHFVEFGKDVMS
jgi:hypothetical protein